MPVKINGTTSGSVTLAAPDTGSDVTLSLPDAAGTVATQSWVQALPIGKVLQVVAASYSTSTAVSGTSFSSIGISASITPSTNTSKIAVFASVYVDARSSGAQSGAKIKVLRGATAIHESLGDGDIFINAATSSGLTIVVGRITPIILDSPATTSSITYSIQGCGAQADDTATFQQNSNTSYLLLAEIGA